MPEAAKVLIGPAEIALTQDVSLSNKASYLYVQDLDDDIPMIDIPGFTNNAVLNFRKRDWMNFSFNIEKKSFVTVLLLASGADSVSFKKILKFSQSVNLLSPSTILSLIASQSFSNRN